MSSIVSKDGTILHVHHWPVERPLAVLSLVHGFGEHGGRYDHLAAHLNVKGIAVVAVDFHGHGKTIGPRGFIRDYDDFRDDLAVLLNHTRQLYPDVPHLLFGHSMGGGIVLDYGFAPDPDVRAIIASAPLIELAAPPPAIIKSIAKLIGTLFPKAAMSQPIDGTKISTLTDEQLRYESDPLCHGRLGFRTARGMIETGELIAERADRWNTPLLLYHSPLDQLTAFDAAKRFADKAAKVEFHRIDDVAHEMHNDVTRDHVYALITEFILSYAKEATP